MKKLSVLLKESTSIDEIEDYFLNINDILGNPVKRVIGDKNFVIYEFIWNIKFSIGEYNNIDILDDLFKCFNCIKEVKVSQERIKGYDIDFKISSRPNKLSIRVMSDSASDSGYVFLIKSNYGREVKISYFSIVKFFKQHGYRVLDIIEQDDEQISSSSLNIITNADEECVTEFCRMFNLEVSIALEEEELIKNIYAHNGRNGYISINPDEEKTYITLVRDK